MSNLNIAELMRSTIDDNKKKILDAQREQLSEKKRGDRRLIIPKYTRAYADKKGFKNPDLKASGDLYANLDLQIGVPNDKEYSIYSDVDYFAYVNERYDKAFELHRPGKKVPEINNEFLEKYHEAINK